MLTTRYFVNCINYFNFVRFGHISPLRTYPAGCGTPYDAVQDASKRCPLVTAMDSPFPVTSASFVDVIGIYASSNPFWPKIWTLAVQLDV